MPTEKVTDEERARNWATAWDAFDQCAKVNPQDPLAVAREIGAMRQIVGALTVACPMPRDPNAYLSPFHNDVLKVAKAARELLNRIGGEK